MSIRKFKRQQDENVLLQKRYKKDLTELNEKLVLFNNEELPAIIQTVETHAKTSGLILEKRLYEIMPSTVPPWHGLRIVEASLDVPGTSVRLKISNRLYTRISAPKEGNSDKFLSNPRLRTSGVSPRVKASEDR